MRARVLSVGRGGEVDCCRVRGSLGLREGLALGQRERRGRRARRGMALHISVLVVFVENNGNWHG